VVELPQDHRDVRDLPIYGLLKWVPWRDEHATWTLDAHYASYTKNEGPIHLQCQHTNLWRLHSIASPEFYRFPQ
jgi:hypothetical protein